VAVFVGVAVRGGTFVGGSTIVADGLIVLDGVTVIVGSGWVGEQALSNTANINEAIIKVLLTVCSHINVIEVGCYFFPTGLILPPITNPQLPFPALNCII
jgi:hypothetical protein